MNVPTYSGRLEEKVDALVVAVNRLVLFEERQAVQALAIIENGRSIKELNSMLSARIDKVDKRIEEAEAKLAMWINRGVGVWALAVTLFTAYKAFIN